MNSRQKLTLADVTRLEREEADAKVKLAGIRHELSKARARHRRAMCAPIGVKS